MSTPATPRTRHRSQIDFLDLGFDRLTLDETLDWIVARGDDSGFAYVVTPNVDHMVRRPKLRGAAADVYAGADLCLCDSRILARLANACGVELPVVPGSDLTAALLERALPDDCPVLLIGADQAAFALLARRFPRLRFHHHLPPMGLLHDEAARAAAIAAAAAVQARILLIAVGSPQQELLALEMKRGGLAHGTALCIGASVDFLVGRERRAPRLIQRAGLEWAWRLAGNPRRLARRYLIDDPAIFAMTFAWYRRRRRPDHIEPMNR